MKELSAIDKAANAIGWIEVLIQNGPELPQQRHRLGDIDKGFCCLGLGCFALEIPYDPDRGTESAICDKTGLRSMMGFPSVGHKVDALLEMNDAIGLGFKRIGSTMRDNAEAYFEPEVAAIIRKMYADGVV